MKRDLVADVFATGSRTSAKGSKAGAYYRPLLAADHLHPKAENPLELPLGTIARLIDCLTCKAEIGAACMSGNGRVVSQPHRERIRAARNQAWRAYEQALLWKERCEH